MLNMHNILHSPARGLYELHMGWVLRTPGFWGIPGAGKGGEKGEKKEEKKGEVRR